MRRHGDVRKIFYLGIVGDGRRCSADLGKSRREGNLPIARIASCLRHSLTFRSREVPIDIGPNFSVRVGPFNQEGEVLIPSHPWKNLCAHTFSSITAALKARD